MVAAEGALSAVRTLQGGMSAPRLIGVDQSAVAQAAVSQGVPGALAWAWAVKAEAGFIAGMKDQE